MAALLSAEASLIFLGCFVCLMAKQGRGNLRRSQQTSCLFISPQGEALPRLGQLEIWVKSGPRW